MKTKLVCTISFFLVIIKLLASETNGELRFHRLKNKQGLSNSTVMSIVQDRNQMLWIATFDGLNRYDGYNFKVYHHKTSKKNSLLNDLLRVLFIDKQGELWIGSKDGLSHYISEKDNFDNFVYTYPAKEIAQINAIIEYDDDKLLLGTDDGLLLFDKKNCVFEQFPMMRKGKTIIQCLTKQDDCIFIGTDKGLYLYRISEHSYTNIHKDLYDKKIQSILYQSKERIWIGTEGYGLFLLNLVTGELKNYKHKPEDSSSICSNYIRTLEIDSQFRLWIGTFNGLSLLANGDETFDNYSHNPMDEGSLSQNSIRSIFKDMQGGMWLGTYYGGLNYFHPLRNQFRHMQQNPYTRTLNDKVLSCISEDDDGTLWIGTNDNGINVYNPQNNRFIYYNRSNNSLFTSNNIKIFLFSHDKKHIYVGTHAGGLLYMDKTTGRGKAIDIPSDNVYALCYGLNEDVWIGTLDGLFRYNEKTKETNKFERPTLNSKQIFYLKVDSKNRLWIGGDRSLGMYELTTQKFKNYTSNEYYGTISNGAINSIMEDSQHVIWIATRGGLSRFSEKNDRFKTYSKEDGLPNNVIYGIIEDDAGDLWISTNNGLGCFNTKTEHFRNYSDSDLLPFSQFNMYSFCKTSSGLIYFGGIDGLISFYPDLLMDNPFTAEPKIIKIQISNKEISPFDETGILNDNILNTKKIKLKPYQSNIGFEFVVSNYLSGKHNLFAYKLDGLDKDWNYTSHNRFVTYSNLQSGSYTFMVKAANSDGRWSDKQAHLTVVVLPDWWQTWWAVLLFSLVGLSVLYALYYFLHQRRLMEKQLVLEHMERDKMAEVNQMKMRFFINISHEFKTPLTLILSPLQEMLERTTNKWEASQLKFIEKNANKLMRLVNQLMDYRRAELGIFELKAQYTVPRNTVYETFSLFDKMARQRNIAYNLEYQPEDKEFLIDLNFLEIILSNLLSNAFKYTPENGTISVRVEEELNYLILEIEDTGCGISKEKLPFIFDRYYQIDDSMMGSGIGLSLVKKLLDIHHGSVNVKSEIDRGSTFSIFFPQNEEEYEMTEIDKSKDKHKAKQNNINFLIDSEPNEAIQVKSSLSFKGTLLIVEDNDDMLTYLNESLSESYKIINAKNGEEALKRVKENQIDLILTDVMMDKMDGIKLCKTIKQNIRTCHIPVIMLSAKSNISDQLKGLKVGADDYLSKPFTLSVLNAKIQNMLKSRIVIKEYYSSSSEIEPEKVAFNELDKELLTKAGEIVMKNLDNAAFSADLFSAEMGMSRSNFHLKLKAITGESTIDFIRKIRFNEASKLLLDGRYNIAEVSTMVGFNSPSYFATSFKKYFGCLPTDYIKKQRGKKQL